MEYPVILEPGPEGGYSVMVPDLPGCFSQGDSFAEAVSNAREAIELHLFGLREDGLVLPSASTVEVIQDEQHPEFQYALVEIDPSQLGRGVRRLKARRIQVTMPPQLLAAIDGHAAIGGVPRSRWLQNAARLSLKQEPRAATFDARKGVASKERAARAYSKKRTQTTTTKAPRTTRTKATKKRQRK